MIWYLDPYLKEIRVNFTEIFTGNPRERPAPNVSTSDLIMVCIDLVKDQVEILVNDINRKMFFGNLITLIEKSPDPKLLRSLTDVVASWVQSPTSGVTLKEKTLLLTKMNQNYENHFPGDQELMASFLKIILHVYTDNVLQAELGSKLESAFMTGLRFVGYCSAETLVFITMIVTITTMINIVTKTVGIFPLSETLLL